MDIVGPFPLTSIVVKDVLEWKPKKGFLVLYFNYNIKNLDFDRVILSKIILDTFVSLKWYDLQIFSIWLILSFS